MGERRALVIGAPNDAFGKLRFLPRAVDDLYRAVTDPERGACVPALPGGADRLVGADATRQRIAHALDQSTAAAGRDGATLFVYFVGHGHWQASTLYLVASDTDHDRVN